MDQSLFNRILALVGFGKKGVLGLPKMSLMGLGSIGVSLTGHAESLLQRGSGLVRLVLQISSSLVVLSPNRCEFGESLHYSQEGAMSPECTPRGEFEVQAGI